MIKTFKGVLGDGDQDRIRLGTIKGKVGYRIVKFQVIGMRPGALNYEAIVQVWKTDQTAVGFVATIDFTNINLLGIATWSSSTNNEVYSDDTTIIFDREIINQDIYITSQDLQDQSMNYYLELETIDLTDMAAEYTTIKDLRATA